MDLTTSVDAFDPSTLLLVAGVVVSLALLGGLLVMLVGGRG